MTQSPSSSENRARATSSLSWTPQSALPYPRSVVKGPSDKQTSHLHPTQKPVWLCERLVLTYTNPGEVVLDCCAGSASIGVACCRTGRRYIGIENEKQYYDVMRTRLRECCRSHSKEVG